MSKKRLPETKWKAALKRWSKGIDAYYELIAMLEEHSDVDDVYGFQFDWSEFRPFGFSSFKEYIEYIEKD